MPETLSEENNLDQLYREVLFDHYRRPRNKGALPACEIITKGHNPVCGDRVNIYAKLSADGNKIEQLAFDGKACAICTASASMMTELLAGKTVTEAEQWSDKFKAMLRNEIPFETPPEAPDMEALEGVKKFPVRVKCATLAWTTLKNGILARRAGQESSETNEECAT